MRFSELINKFEIFVRHLQLNIRDWKTINELHLPKLTNKELAELRHTWPCFKFRKLDLAWSRLYKQHKGFSPFFLNDAQYVKLLRVINPHNAVSSLQNKAMCDVYFPEIPFPKVLVRYLNGNFYDARMNLISQEDVRSILLSESECIVKPALDTQCGIGVKKVKLINGTPLEGRFFEDDTRQSYIIQEVLQQHPEIRRFNETSLNCCRITSLYINGKYDWSACLKVGKKGSELDNWNGAYMLGITRDGLLKDVAYDSSSNEVKMFDNGIVFGGLIYPHFNKLVSTVERLHKQYFPNCGIIGWDVIIDDKDNVKVIETNVVYPGILGEQLCGDLFFQNFREEIVKLFKY